MDYLLEQLGGAGQISCRKMFGEYALYLSGKVVGLVCDDQLYIKPTEAGRLLLEPLREGFPFPGARAWFVVPGEAWEDADWLASLVEQTAACLPQPKFKRPKRTQARGMEEWR
jgi:DNA transformation protein